MIGPKSSVRSTWSSLELHSRREVRAPSVSNLVDLKSLRRAGLVLGVGDRERPPSPDASMNVACRLLARPAYRHAAPILISCARGSLEMFSRAARDSLRDLRKRGLAPSCLCVELDLDDAGELDRIHSLRGTGIGLAIRVPAAQLENKDFVVRALESSASLGVATHARDLASLEHLSAALEARLTWASGPALGAASSEPRPLGDVQKCLLRLARRHVPAPGLRAQLDAVASALVALVPLEQGTRGGLLTGARAQLARARDAHDAAEHASARAAFEWETASSELDLVLAEVAVGRSPPSETLLSAITGCDLAGSLRVLAAREVAGARVQLESARASVTLRLEAARGAQRRASLQRPSLHAL